MSDLASVVPVVDDEKVSYDGQRVTPELHSTANKTDKEVFVASARESCIDVEATPAPNEEQDPNVVDWDGPDDPANPQNWPSFRRWGTVAVVAGITFLAPLGSSYIAPGVPALMKEVCHCCSWFKLACTYSHSSTRPTTTSPALSLVFMFWALRAVL